MLPARRYRPRHAARSTPRSTHRSRSTQAVPAGLLLSAAGIAFVGFPPSAAPGPAGPPAPQTVTLAVLGVAPAGVAPASVAPALPADPVARERAQRRASEQQARADAAARADEARREQARASRAERRPLAVRPVAKGPLTSPFGPRWGRLHAGIDFGVPVGTPVVAVADGVVEARYDPAGYGRYVVVKHAGGTTSLYGHLSKVVVERGRVQAGDVLGRSGNTGHSTGPHLHFEMRTGRGPFDAQAWLRERDVKV